MRSRDEALDYDAVRWAISRRARGRCEAATPDCLRGDGHEPHHRWLRSQGGPDTMGNLLWTCWACHRWIHANVAAARDAGLIARPGHLADADRARVDATEADSSAHVLLLTAIFCDNRAAKTDDASEIERLATTAAHLRRLAETRARRR